MSEVQNEEKNVPSLFKSDWIPVETRRLSPTPLLFGPFVLLSDSHVRQLFRVLQQPLMLMLTAAEL